MIVMILQPKFNIGDAVFLAHSHMEQKKLPCPDCLGTNHWAAKSPAGTEYSFACPRCNSRYSSQDNLSLFYSSFEPAATNLTIGSIQFNSENERSKYQYMCVETGVGSGSVYHEADIFKDREAALEAAKIQCSIKNSDEGSLPKKTYDKALSVCDYQLLEGVQREDRESSRRMSYKLHDFIQSIKDCTNMSEIKEVLQDHDGDQS